MKVSVSVLPHMSVAVKDSVAVIAERSRIGKFRSVVVVTVPVADVLKDLKEFPKKSLIYI